MTRLTRMVCASTLVMASAMACRPSAPAPQQNANGRLLVIVVVDQLRSDYLDHYKQFWKHGFARLLENGAIFERAAYPYLNTVTCAGHATIGSGAFPSTHGVIMNEWWQRDTKSRMSCTADPAVTSVPYSGIAEPLGHSAHRLRIPSLGDRLRASSPESRVVSLSMKPRSAVMLAGHGGIVTWFSDANTWATSSAFATAPVPEVQSFVSAHPIDRYRGEVWERVLDPSAYSGVDDGIGERPPRGWTRVFAHPLAGNGEGERDRFHDLWERSPYSDVELGTMAAALVKSLALGQRGVVDLLGVSFSALDYVGHNFGPVSHEVQDTLIRLDQTLGKFMQMLDEAVGTDNYVLALSADHGVGYIPEAIRQRDHDAGRVLQADVRKVAEAAMVAAYGRGPHIAHVEYTEIYFADRTKQLIAQRPDGLKRLYAALESIPGVMRAMSTADLASRRQSADPAERAAAYGHFPGASGDVQIILKLNWVGTDTSAASHGTLHSYDQQVPVIFYGDRIKSGRYREAATPADIAPTLAATIDLALPDIDGSVLKSALK